MVLRVVIKRTSAFSVILVLVKSKLQENIVRIQVFICYSFNILKIK